VSPVIVGIFEHNDAIFSCLFPFFVGIGFRNPQPPTIIQSHRNRLANIRFSGEESNLEAFGDVDGIGCLPWRGRFITGLLSVAGLVVILS